MDLLAQIKFSRITEKRDVRYFPGFDRFPFAKTSVCVPLQFSQFLKKILFTWSVSGGGGLQMPVVGCMLERCFFVLLHVSEGELSRLCHSGYSKILATTLQSCPFPSLGNFYINFGLLRHGGKES